MPTKHKTSLKAKTPAKCKRVRADDAPLTAAELRTARPIREAMPELLKAYNEGTLTFNGRPMRVKKTPVSISLPPDVIAAFKSQGADWQARMGNVLKAVADVMRG